MIDQYFNHIIFIWIGIAVVVFLVLVLGKIRTPYGKFASDSWGKVIDNEKGWFWMELPAVLIFPLLLIYGSAVKGLLTWLLLVLWLIHYINRTFIFPFRLQKNGNKMPIIIVYSGIFFNLINGFLIGYYYGFIGGEDSTLLKARILIGIAVFFIGMYINHSSDKRLIALRKDNAGYQIPQGWLFHYISCPNYFGEIIEWIGYSIIAWNLPAASFAIWSFCNLVPRALSNHEWYRETFKLYPEERRALIPFLW